MAAAHEGTAELVISVVYENGGTTDVPLDRYASEVLLQACKDVGIGQAIHGCLRGLPRTPLESGGVN